MEDKKDKNLDNTPDEELSESVKDEMEELRKTFQEELDKAKQEAKQVAETAPEEPEILIQDLEEIPEETANEAVEEIPEDELCECCGEKRKGTVNNPNSDYCADCEKGLRHYPFEFLNILIALIVVGFAIYGCYVFTNYSEIYVAAEKADKYVSQGKLYTAYDAYEATVTTMEDAEVNGEMVYKRLIDTTMRVGGINYISDYAEQFKSWEIKLPHLRTVYNAFSESTEFLTTRDDAYAIVQQFNTENAEDIPYDEVMAAIDSLEKTTPAVTAESDDTTTTAPFNLSAKKYSKSMLLYVKFTLASLCGRDATEQMGYLEKIWQAEPEKTWLYVSPLGTLYAKNGKDVTELCAQSRKINSEDTSADVIEATALRVKGDYSGCKEICNKLIDAGDGYAYEFYRQMALCDLATGSYTSAYENANSAYQDYGATIQICDTLALCSAASGNEETYQEMVSLFSSNDMELSKEVLDYKAGTLTIAQIVSEGDFDVE